MDTKTLIQEKQQEIDWYDGRIEELKEQLKDESCPFEREYLRNYLTICRDSRARARERILELKFHKPLKTEV